MTTPKLSTKGTSKKSFLAGLIFTVFTTSSIVSPLQAKAAYTTSVHSDAECTGQAIGIPNVGLQVAAYPLENVAKMKIKFTNATRRQILLLIKNEIGRVIYSKFYPQSTYFEGIFDLSLLESGKYTLQVSTLTKAGFIKHSYKQTFFIESYLKRSISPFAPAPEKNLITLGID